jgi:diacylglycerol O-acyltransferase
MAAPASNCLVISIAAGPQAQLYFLGCEVEAMYPLGPLFHGRGLNVTAMSLNGKLNVGVICCPDVLPDLWRLVDDFDVALEELLECAIPAQPTAKS